MTCSRCGYRFSSDARTCVVCGNKGLPALLHRAVVLDATAVSLRDDTVELPPAAGDMGERVVRPTLAVLFRLAVGPAADYYTPRFLRYEGAGGYGAPGWHWPALLLQSIWAFYRRLWLPGVFYALLPVAGALAFLALAPTIDDWSVAWWLCAGVCMWLGPGIIAAMLSTPLLYGRIRRLVRRAERIGGDAAQAAALLAARRSTSFRAALLLGGGALALALASVAPNVRTAYEEHAVRSQVAESLSALSPLMREVEEQLSYFAALPRPFSETGMNERRWTKFFDDVSISPINGRLRVGLGPSIPELWGKTILLAPATDWLQRVHWTCIPIDIPARYLPKECRPRSDSK